MTDGRGNRSLQELTVEECYLLLETQQVGRLGVNAEHYPLIFPVNYALDRGVIVIRTHPGTKLAAASHANVTFKVDRSTNQPAAAGACWSEAWPRRSPPPTGRS